MTYNPRLQYGGPRQPRRLPNLSKEERRRSLSQNFLTNPTTIRRIVRAARPDSAALVVEVGAGDGRLTAALASTGSRVVAHEIDPELAERLRSRCRGMGNVACVQGDFLAYRPPHEPFAVVGNIPYAVTSPIVDWCLRAPALTSATLVTQLEYARKRTGDFGRWSKVTVQSWPYVDWRLAGRIDRHDFRPVPRVDSAILQLLRRPDPLLARDALAAYTRMVEVGFGGAGGSLRASLRRAYPRQRVDTACHDAGIGRETVVAFVHPDQWIALFHGLHLR